MNLDSDCTAGQKCSLLCCGLINERLINTLWSICWLFRSLSCFPWVVFMFDNFPPFWCYSWQHVLCFSQTERECVVGGSQYAGLEERRAQGGGLHFTQRSVERVPILWEEEAPCLFPTHRPLFSTNTLLRSTFSLVRTLWRAFNLLMTTMNNWKLLRSVWKLRCVSFEMEVTPGHHLQTK